jgi:parallel beta-helix repeat protein
MVGDPYQTTRQWTEALTWGGVDAQPCSEPQHLYCFQQDDYYVSTDPNNQDSDGDGFSDLHEVQGNTDPNITEDYPIISQLYVDAAGDDNNLGDAAHPLKTLHAAVSRANASPEVDIGINLMEAAVYTAASEGTDTPVVLHRNMTINGNGAFLDGAGAAGWDAGLTLSPGAENTTLQNLTIQNFQQGLAIQSDGGCVVMSGVTISNCETGIELAEADQLDLDLGDTLVTACEMGVKITAGSANTTLRNGQVRNSIGDGIHLERSNQVPQDIRLEGIQVADNGGNGIFISDGAGHEIFGCTITNNNLTETAYGGIAVIDSCAILRNNEITGNHCFGVFAGDALSTQPLDATDNWWGNDSGPSGEGPGSGDAVSAHVIFAPWTGYVSTGDDDNDGWPNTAEEQAGTNPFDGNDFPTVTEFYVGGAGADDNNLGDNINPLATLHGAVARVNNILNDYYTIHLTAGNYDVSTEGQDEAVIISQNVTIIGNGAVLDGSGAANWTAGLTISPGGIDVILQDLTVQNFEKGLEVNSDGGCVRLDNVNVNACEIGLDFLGSYQVEADLTGSQIYGCQSGIRVSADSASIVLQNGTVSNNSSDGIRVEGSNQDPSDIHLDGIQVSGNGANGIIFFDGSGHQVTNCMVSGNNTSRTAYGGIAVLTGGVSVNNNEIVSNQCFGIYADDALSTENLDATNNWWGDDSGPSGEGPGTGDAVSAHVLFTPWVGMPPQGDSDGDGWPDLAEQQAGSDPQNAADYPSITTFYAGGVNADDLNLGGTLQPLKTLHGAVHRINSIANGAYTIILTSGAVYSLSSEGLDEPISINQNVTLEGAGAILDGAGATVWTTGLVLSVGANNVTVRNLTIQNFKIGLGFLSDGGCVSFDNVGLSSCEKGLQMLSGYQVDVDLNGLSFSGCLTGIEITGDSSGNILRNGSVAGNTGNGIVFDSSNVAPTDNLITGVQIFNNAENGIAFLGGFDNQVSDCVIFGNNVGNNWNHSGAGGVYINSAAARIMWNTIRDNSCAGVFAEETNTSQIHGNVIYGNADGIRLSFTSGVLIESNTVTVNQNGIVVEGGSSPEILRNIAWANDGGYDLVVRGDYTNIEFNDIGTSDPAGLPANNISLGPGFNDPQSNDYTLTASSPCVDGTDLVEPGRDRAGSPRPQGNTWDMGAYESSVDSDNNGMDDWWEIQHFGHIGVDPNGDEDLDGLSNLQEFQAGSDPLSDVSLTITNPAGSPFYTGDDEVTLSGTSSNAAQIDIRNNGTLIETLTSGLNSWSSTAPVPIDEGENLISVTATGGGDPATASVTVIRDYDTPQVFITVPDYQETYETSDEYFTVSGLASDDTQVDLVTWSRSAGSDTVSGDASGNVNWTAAGIPLVIGDNVITITAADQFLHEGSVSITVTRIQEAIADNTDLTPQEDPPPPADPMDLDGDGYHYDDEIHPDCDTDPNDGDSNNPGAVPTNFGLDNSGVATKYPTNPADANFNPDRVKRNENGEIIDAYNWPDCTNPDDDGDQLPDLCEDKYAGFDSHDPTDDPNGNPDEDLYTNLEECQNKTDPFTPEPVGFTLAVTDIKTGQNFQNWLPQYEGVLKIAATWAGTGPAPEQVNFRLENTSRHAGRAVNDPNPAVTTTNYPAWYAFNGFDFGLTATNPISNPDVHSFAQELTAVAGTGGVYTAYLQCWDYGGSTRAVVTLPGIAGAEAGIQVPIGSAGTGISSAWAHDSGNPRLDPNADIDKIIFDEKEYPAPLGDDFNNYDEYRGILNTLLPSGELQHKRLNPRRKDLFLRAVGFDPELAPFALGDAFSNAGIDIHDTTDWGHDATEDGTFFVYYRVGSVADISGYQVTGLNTEWATHWPKREWELKLVGDPEAAWTPIQYWGASNKLTLAYPYPASSTVEDYAIRKPVPHINVVIIRHDWTNPSSMADEDGYINFITAVPPGGTNTDGTRYWTWDHKGQCKTNSAADTPTMYGLPVTYEIPLQHLFNDRPYLEGTVWVNSWDSDPDGKLAPLSQVEDQADQLSPIDGIMVGDKPNGFWDGDRRTTDKNTWDNVGQLNPFNIDNDDYVELPVSSNADLLAGEGRADNEADRATVLKLTVTHELGHALAGDAHSKDPRCLMHFEAIDWKRADYISDYYRSLLRVHNEIR